MSRIVAVVALLITILFPALTSAASSPDWIAAPDSKNLVQASVLKVTDGDTIHVALDNQDVTIRLIGIDTPETVDPREPVACYGAEASDFTKSVLGVGRTVYLEKDVSETDRYGRLLRYVWIRYVADDEQASGITAPDPDHQQLVLFNQLLVVGGYAESSSYPPDVKYQDQFVADQHTARDANTGLWGSCSAFGVAADGSSTSGGAEPSSAPTATSAPVIVPTPTEVSTSTNVGADQCDPSYPDFCISPVSVAGDLDCADIGSKNFTVLPPDPHRLDGDHDGVGCES